MLTVLSKLKDFAPIISVRVDDGKSLFLICSAHLHQVLLSKANYSCTTNDIHFPKLGKIYCRSCVTHYIWRKCAIYPFVVFNNDELYFYGYVSALVYLKIKNAFYQKN